MFLKKIEIQGFKSFAEKTVIEFKSGITGVVGPNGSGKSNISDSIRWVLGEQSAKSLRGSKMEDVVFAGTDKRKPLGFAEVTLTLDNSDKILDIEYSEVSVTRRVFRSGESEYYINKNSCRLRDIKELFMDTGIGEDGYSIIGQGRIDEILSSKSEDRRNIFEEASGIVKYKTRKEEAEKKLGKTEENLVRINDIVSELEKQLKPLETQSKKALEYKELSEELKVLQINLYINEILDIKQELDEIEVQKNLASEQLKKKQDYKVQLDNKYKLTKREIEKMDLNIEKIKSHRFDTKTNIEKKKNEISLINEKISYFNKEIERYKDEILELKKHISESKGQEKLFEEKDKLLTEKLEDLKQDLKQKDDEFQKIKGGIEKKESYIEDKKSDIIKTYNLIADKKSQINSYDSFKENIEKRLGQINDEILELKSLQNDIKKNASELEEKINNYKLTLNKITDELKGMSIKKNNKTIKLQDINRNLSNIKSDLQSKTSRHRVLSDMSKEYEGYYKGVKNALKACERNSELGQGVKGVLAELITTPKKYEKAIEVALGSSIQNIVIDTQDNAKRIINHLKARNLGRVTFLPMSSISKRYLNNSEKGLLNEDGVIGVGADILDYDDQYKDIISYLLGRVVFVEKIEDGIAVSKKCNYSLRIVSLDGDVLNPGGSMTGGSLNNYNTKLLGRQREIDELKAESLKLEVEYENASKEKENIERELLVIEEEIIKKNELITEIRLSLATDENKYSQIRQEGEKNKSLIEKFSSEQKNLFDENTNIEKDNYSIRQELKELEEKNILTQSNIEDELYEFENEKTKSDQMDKDITQIKIAKASLEQEHKNIIETVFRLKKEVERSEASIESKEKEKDNIRSNIADLNKEVEEASDKKDNFENQLNDYELKLEEISSDKNNYIQSFKNEETKLQTINNEIIESEKGINSLDLKVERYNIQYDNFNSKLWEKYELSFHMALEYKQKIENIKEAQSIVKETKEKIRSLGHINLNAIEEYKNIKERYEFMTDQIEDLTYAKDSLDEVIKEMYEKMTEQFTQSFKIIRQNFIEVFKELFGGGKSDVYLTDEVNVLSSGIEIVAQPPGKKLQSLLLLSGGERALTAIALLFAIIKTKPTPFCVLDEIEAALDEANVYRYAEYLKQFSNTTQFIAITHRKGTMENVDSLYGVTMEEDGISKLISIKLSEKEQAI